MACVVACQETIRERTERPNHANPCHLVSSYIIVSGGFPGPVTKAGPFRSPIRSLRASIQENNICRMRINRMS